MKSLRFVKMQGCGNDYIYFDCFHQQVPEPEKVSVSLSDRHFGVGGDGIVLICPPDSPEADARMRMFNADGSEGKMCGNAIRCVGKYLYESGAVRRTRMKIDTLSGIKFLELDVQGETVKFVNVHMGKAGRSPEEIPVKLSAKAVIAYPTVIRGKEYLITCLSMGNPHCVVFLEPGEVEKLDLEQLGPSFENSPLFPERINTEFVCAINPHTLRMRVWERGSGETMACGTGACAAAAAAVWRGFCPAGEPIRVLLNGGELEIRVLPDGTVWMAGPAERVFDGEIRLSPS